MIQTEVLVRGPLLLEHLDVSLKLLDNDLGQPLPVREGSGHGALERPSITQRPLVPRPPPVATATLGCPRHVLHGSWPPPHRAHEEPLADGKLGIRNS